MLLIDNEDLEKAASVYLKLANKSKAMLELLLDTTNKLDEKKLEELTKTLKAMN